DFDTYRERVTGREPGAPREGLPPGLERVLRVAMSRAPRDRYPDARAFARALAAVRDGTVAEDTAAPSEPQRRAPEVPEAPERPEEREPAPGPAGAGEAEPVPEESGPVASESGAVETVSGSAGAEALAAAQVPSEAGEPEPAPEESEALERAPLLSEPGPAGSAAAAAGAVGRDRVPVGAAQAWRPAGDGRAGQGLE